MTTHYMNPFHAYMTPEMRTVIEMHHLSRQPKITNAYRWQDDAFTTVAKCRSWAPNCHVLTMCKGGICEPGGAMSAEVNK